jgi:hypothetical protein
MNRRLAMLVLIGAVLVSVGQASARTDIQRQYKRWARAAVSNDVDTILSILAPDYALHTYTGTTIKRADYEASLRKRKAANKPATAYQTKINSVQVEGPTALVVSDETSEAVSLDPVTNKKVRLIHIHRYLDTWIKSGKLWRLRTTITKVESTTVAPV